MDTISTICRLTIQGKFYKMIGSRIFLVPVEDGETVHILDYDVTFFDILSTKARQFGFTTILKNGRRFTCAGDEPYNAECRPYVEGSDWLLHEAFCLYRDRDIFEPYEKHHSTVKEACELAKELSIPNLVLWHTEDKHLSERKALYTAEGREYYDGNLLVPVNYKTEDGFCLGDWVRRMRENYACAEKKLTSERIAKLEALGMVWTVPQEG